MQEIYWSSAISELQDIQKREYEELVLNTERVTIPYINLNDFVVLFFVLSEKRHYIICKQHNTPIPVLVQIVEEEYFK